MGGVQPCSLIQERWFRFRERHPDKMLGGPFRMSLHLALRGALDRELLTAVVPAIVGRQWILRTAVHRDGDEVVQRLVDPPESARLSFVDLRAVPGGGKRAAEIHREHRLRPIDVQRGEMFIATLIQLEDDLHELVLTFDHLAGDAQSFRRFQHELFAAYAALRRDPTQKLLDVVAPLRHQYVEWAHEQRALLAGRYGATVRAYWADRMKGAQALSLPLDREPEGDLGPLGHCHGTVDAPLFDRIGQFARETQVTTPMALLSILFVLLHRTSGQTDLGVTVPSNGRRRKYTEVIGAFTTPLLVRVEITDTMKFRELARCVGQTLLHAYSLGAVPIYSVCQPPRELWRLSFNYQRQIELPECGLQIEPLPVKTRTGHLDLQLVLRFLESVAGDHANVAMLFRTDAFEASSVQKLFDDFVSVAQDLMASPDQRVRSTRS